MHKIIHHLDLDGCCSAFLVYNHLKSKGETEFIFIETEYGRPIPEVKEGEDVWIVDFSYDQVTIEKWMTIANVTWVDHHKSALERFRSFCKFIPGLRVDDDKSACALVWEYLYKSDIPIFVDSISKVDVHAKEGGDDDRDFCLGLQSYIYEPTSKVWEWLLDDAINEDTEYKDIYLSIIDEGATIRDYIMREGVKYVANNGYWVINRIGRNKCFVCNNGNILAMKAYAPDADVWANFYYAPDIKWTVIFYSDTVDVEELAKIFGGGGHRYAAGFQTNDIRFLLNGVAKGGL